MATKLQANPSIVEAIHNLGYKVDNRPFYLNLFGVRSEDCTIGEYNDILGYFYFDDNGQLVIDAAAASTDPGTYWAQHPERKEGTAFLKEGQWDYYYSPNVKGAPGFRPLSLLTVYRKTPGQIVDFSSLPTYTETVPSEFGILIHRNWSQTVNKRDSAGCQVTNLHRMHVMTNLAKKTIALYKRNRFYYTLLTEEQISSEPFQVKNHDIMENFDSALKNASNYLTYNYIKPYDNQK